MHIRRLIYRSGIIAVFLPLLSVLPSRAQTVTFDPTQSAHAIQQIYDRAKDAQTWQQQLSYDIQMAGTSLKDYQQAITTYNMLYGNLKNFNSKQVWRTIELQLTMASIANNYGETTGLQGVMNGQSPGNASTVWKFINLGLNSTSSGFLSQQVLGTSRHFRPLPAWKRWMESRLSAFSPSETTTSNVTAISHPNQPSLSHSLIPRSPRRSSNSSISSTSTTRMGSTKRNRRARSMLVRRRRPLSRTWLNGPLQLLRSTMQLPSSSRGRAIPPRRRTARQPGRHTCLNPGDVMEQLIQWIVARKLLLGIASLLMGIAIVLAAILHANRQTAAATSRLAAERDRAAQIDQDDKAAVEKIKERNRQKAAAAPQKYPTMNAA